MRGLEELLLLQARLPRERFRIGRHIELGNDLCELRQPASLPQVEDLIETAPQRKRRERDWTPQCGLTQRQLPGPVCERAAEVLSVRCIDIVREIQTRECLPSSSIQIITDIEATAKCL
jgi:hypothetical protein